MQKRAGRESSKCVKCAAFSEIFVLIIAIAAFAFVLNESTMVSGAGAPSSTQAGGGGKFIGPQPYTEPSEKIDPFDFSGLKFEGEEKSASSTNFIGALGEALTWATAVVTLVQLIAPAAGADKQLTNALSASLAAGVFVGRMAAEVAKGAGYGSGVMGEGAAGFGLFVGVVVAVAVFVLTYKVTKQSIITYTCSPWQAPIGGKDCEKCNGDPFRPCTEYRCRSLGQACQLLNKDKPGREMCSWINPKDVNSPTISPYVAALYPADLKYIEDTSVRPPALGVKIARGDGSCLLAYTPLKFGVNTNEPSQCKIDTNHTLKFDQMQYYLGGSSDYMYNHTEMMRLPGPIAFNDSLEAAPIFKNDGTTQLFIRCRDANGNENADEYSVKFCVDPSPDTTPPLIEGASIANGNPVKYGTTNLAVGVYVNEPAECKWSVDSKPYDDMEMRMGCDTVAPQIINAIPTFVCIANLTGLKNNFDNKFYFRCKDQPGKNESERNVMVQSYEYVLKGSQPLNIIRVSPNRTVSGSSAAVTVDLEVETDDGAEEGKAICGFAPTANGPFVSMFETSSFRHKQTLQLTSGTYTYYFRCTDLGGNSADARTTFAVFSDLAAPKVSRVYKEEGTGLKVVTDEDAECSYSLTSCNFAFNDGLKLIYSNPSVKTNSYLEWKPNVVYYIKCRDMYGNEPNPNECSVVVKAVEGSTA